MDPYLENPDHWRGIHTALIFCCFEALNRSLPPGFVARIEERIYLTTPQDRFYPDVSVERLTALGQGTRQAVLEAPLRLDIPLSVALEVQEVRQRFVEIVELAVPERVITAIEILSPTNKTPGDGYAEYRRKQKEYIQSATHLVEIDLLRAGTHTVAASKSEIEALFGHWDYLVCLHRAQSGLHGDTWPRTIRQVLPQVLVPLTEAHPDVRLDLQSIVSRIYEAGALERSIDYTLPPIPALRPDDATWADALLQSQGLR